MATRHAANTAALNRNTPDRLKACSTTPPSTGPAIRVALEVAESRLIAAARSPSERSPSRRRRTGMSVAQKMPLRHRCGGNPGEAEHGGARRNRHHHGHGERQNERADEEPLAADPIRDHPDRTGRTAPAAASTASAPARRAAAIPVIWKRVEPTSARSWSPPHDAREAAHHPHGQEAGDCRAGDGEHPSAMTATAPTAYPRNSTPLSCGRRRVRRSSLAGRGTRRVMVPENRRSPRPPTCRRAGAGPRHGSSSEQSP